jgi:plastocyanin
MKRTAAAAALLLPLAFVSLRCDGEGAETGEPGSVVTDSPIAPATQATKQPKTVEIRVDTATGRVIVSPDPIFVEAGDTVVWASASGPWAVHFTGVSPMRVRRIRAPGGERNGGLIREDIAPGKYTYFVAVEVEGRIYTADPDLIDEGEERPQPR